jgi:hypothetical protein
LAALWVEQVMVKPDSKPLQWGIPTITNMTKDYANWLPENPFVVANNFDKLYKALIELIDSEDLRIQKGQKGKEWVKKYHSYENVNKN